MKVLFSKSSEKVAITAKISPDRMKLFIDAEPINNHQVTKADLLAILEPAFPRIELDGGVLESVATVLCKGEKATDRRIHKGIPIIPGLDGKLLILVKKFDGSGEIRTDEKGYGSLTERHLFDNIIVSQVVGRIYAPKLGTPGEDAVGEHLSAPAGKPIKVAVDKTLRIEKRPSEDFESIISQQEGFLVDDSGRLAIHEELSISGDLDLRTGSIDCIGKVKVSGNVSSGLTVRGKKGVVIGGGIQESIVECPHGDIMISGFGFGGQRGRVICGGAVHVRVVQELRIEALKDIIIDKEAVDCSLRTQTMVQMPSGNLIGGEAFVVCGLEAKNIGNEAGKRTTIHLCSDIETSTEFASIESDIASHDQALKLLDVHLGPYAKAPTRIQLLNEPFRGRMQKLSEKRAEVQASRVKLIGKQKSLLEKAHRSETLRVNAREHFYPGVLITAGAERFEIKDLIPGPKTIEYSPKENTFTVRDLEPVVCTVNFEEGGAHGRSEAGKKH